jgi:hypothetical protein
VDSNGNKIKANREENSDLFHGVAGSYGSFATIYSVKIQLISVKKYVKLDYRYFDINEGLEYLKNRAQDTDKIDFLEGLVLENNVVVIEGVLTTKEESQNLPIQTFTKSGDPWFYKYVEKNIKKQHVCELLPLRDYLFRYDRGCFWMGKYATNHLPGGYNWLSRKLLNDKLTTKALYARFHTKSEEEREGKYVIQDCYVPEENISKFVKYIQNKFEIYPLWLCPIKPAKDPQKLSPHYNDSDLMINVGVYGAPNKDLGDPREANKDLERMLSECGGRKMFYAYSYYTKEKFWNAYDKNWYDDLKTKYDSGSKFFDITDKVLRPENN